MIVKASVSDNGSLKAT